MGTRYIRTVDLNDYESNDEFIFQGIKIKNKEEFIRLRELIRERKKDNIKVSIDKKTLYELLDDGLVSPNDEIGFVLEIKDMKEIQKGEIESLEEKVKLKEIALLYQEDYDNYGYGDVYDVEEYNKILLQIEKIKSNISESQTDIEKFLTVYLMLGKLIQYDNDYNLEPNNRADAHSMTGGLLEGRCVCEGFSKILQQALKYVGIDSKLISGKSGDELHMWNQVKINDNWYNCDLTGDYYAIKNDYPFDWCLLGDDEFFDHESYTERKEECQTSYGEINLETTRGKILSDLTAKDALLIPIGIDEEEWYLVNNGLTKEEKICYIIARGMAQSEEEKEKILNEFIGAKLYNIERLKKSAKHERVNGNLEEVFLHLYDCRRSGKNVYVDFKGHRFYSCCDYKEEEVWIEATGFTKEERKKQLDRLFAGDMPEGEDKFYQQVEQDKEENRRKLREKKRQMYEYLKRFDLNAHQERMQRFREERDRIRKTENMDKDIDL